jgi:hypothetical protein
MKALIRNTYLLLISGLTGWLSTGCDNGSSGGVTPQADCRIQKYVAISKSGSYNQTDQTTYTYDGRGNLVGIVSVNDRQPINGATVSHTHATTDTYAYDSEGYLTKATQQVRDVTVFSGKSTEEQVSSVSSYSYSNGRLALYTQAYTTAQRTTTSARAYTYDNAGNLANYTSYNPANPGGTFSIWTYQQNRLVDYVEKTGTSERRPFTIQDGVITKIVIPGSVNELVLTATFDNQRRLIKNEEYIDGVLNRYNTQTWTDAKPSSAALPRFKGFPTVGFPTVGSVAVLSGQEGVLATQKTYYWNSVSKTMQPYNESTSVVETNAQGFVTKTTITVKHSNPASVGQDYTRSETFTYTGCQ